MLHKHLLIILLLLSLLGGLPNETSEPQLATPITEVPILMYHVVGEDEGPYQELFVSEKVFEAQMQYLADNGYNTITLAELYNHWNKGHKLPANPIIITFDDGYRSVYEKAYPAMKQFKQKGVLFIYVDKFNSNNSMTVAEIADMVADGFEVGSHTVSHPDLTKISHNNLENEVHTSKLKLEEMFDTSVVSFSYPAGRLNDDVLNEVKLAGYQTAVTTKYGYAAQEQGLLNLRRIRINRSDSLTGFINKITK